MRAVVHIDGKHISGRQQGPALFRVLIGLAGASNRPSQIRFIEQSLLQLERTADGVGHAAVSQHEGSIRQHDAGCISNMGPSGRRSDGSPGIRGRIVDRAQVGFIIRTTVILAAFNYHLAIGQHGRAKVKWRVARRHGGQLSPGAIHVTSGAAGGQPPPVRAQVLVHHHGAIGEHQSGISVKGWRGRYLCPRGSRRGLGAGDARPCQQAEQRNRKHTECLHRFLFSLLFNLLDFLS